MCSHFVSMPRQFVWGAATASYQIEGAWNLDGKGESIWDRFSHTQGKIANGDNGDIACDHYHRLNEDIVLMQQLGLKAYRFSISWARVLPNGSGLVNQIGLDFYNRLVDMLLNAGIEPYITLYHWDLPQRLQDQGGWENRDVGKYFADYTSTMVGHLGDRVRYWTTLNEPWVIAFLGYRTGEHAPGIQNEARALQVSHNLLVAHGHAVQAIRSIRPNVQTGIVLSLWPTEPATNEKRVVDNAEFGWQKDCGWFLSPLFKGCYPPSVLSHLKDLMPEIQPGDMTTICQKLDFLGVNYYSRNLVGEDGIISPVPGSDYTEMGWEIHAPALRRLLVRLKNEYQVPPLYITENGCALKDGLDGDGRVHDYRRVRFLEDHLAQIHLALLDGVDLRGYFVWSLIDNFEWAHGFSKRFGIYYVDYPTQSRIIKDSGIWYAKVIEENGFVLAEVQRQLELGKNPAVGIQGNH